MSDTIWSFNSCVLGTMRSAASLGVNARTSAAKSARVTSISCPIAETTGMFAATIARITASSLNDHRSSLLPPPRTTTSTSNSGVNVFAERIAVAISVADPSPCTRRARSVRRRRANDGE
ncbi:MAG: hypothetical protein QM811_10575 [Pirellulales bacterium]